jgi:Protein of unknown function (Hypoth_ymh)
MSEGIEVQLSPRIQKHCLKLWQGEYYKHAAREAMVQVELALKEKGMVKDGKFGKTLIDSLFTIGGNHKTVKLRVPLGDDLQQQAKSYFASVFSYYRNYLAHDGSKIDQNSALRILVIASELLDLIDASSLSYADLGGIEGLLKAEVFDSEDQLLGVLKICDGYALPGHQTDGLHEEMFLNYGALDHNLDAVFELDLVRYTDVKFHEPDYGIDEEGGWLEITDLGKQFIDELQRRTSEGL